MIGPLPTFVPGITLGTREENIRFALKLAETFMEHGSRGGYANGCRCDWCKEAVQQYDRKLYARNGRNRSQESRKKTKTDREDFVTSILEDEL